MFAFRYFEVAEMFRREDKTLKKHVSVRKVTSKISYVAVGLMCINYLINIGNSVSQRVDGHYST